MKSSMNQEEMLTGRPYGGIGFVAKCLKHISYRPVSVNSKRIAGVQLVTNGEVILTIYGLYLPHYNGMHDQIELFSETLDILQASIDDMELSPLMIIGDMNATLPSNNQLVRNWYRKHPYNGHSYILYDFLCNNELIVANFNFKQNTSYTYCNAGTKSYIDHVFLSPKAGDLISQCRIIDDLFDNVSDHYTHCIQLLTVKSKQKNVIIAVIRMI